MKLNLRFEVPPCKKEELPAKIQELMYKYYPVLRKMKNIGVKVLINKEKGNGTAPKG